jgi:hypothetical protein
MSANDWYAYEMGRIAIDQQRERDEQAAQRKRQQDMAAQQDEARKNLAINLMLQDASPTEVAQVKSIVAANFPADKYSPERHWRVLQELRNAVGFQ